MTKNIVRCFNLIVGCFFIAIALNLFVIPNNFVTFGATGLSTELFYISNVSPALNILLIHIAIMLLGILVFDAKYVSDYFLSALILPLCIFFTEDLPNLISINITENLTSAQSIIVFKCIKKESIVLFSRKTVTSVKDELFT